MEVGDEIMTVHGATLCMLGDTPASNLVENFKESVAFALRKCRRCMTTGTDMSEKVRMYWSVARFSKEGCPP